VTALLIAILSMPMEIRLWWSECGPTATTNSYLDSVLYGDGVASRWLALDELEAALEFPDDAAFSAERVRIVWWDAQW
jgi:hypothetical protein